jgi:hypothetical protein
MHNYQKIDIKVSPKLFIASLVSKSICECEMSAFNADVPLNQQYTCDLNSVRWARWRCDGCGRVTDVRLIDTYSDIPFVPISWFLLDCLDLGAGIPVSEKPARWEKVKDNQVSPKGVGPRIQKFN